MAMRISILASLSNAGLVSRSSRLVSRNPHSRCNPFHSASYEMSVITLKLVSKCQDAMIEFNLIKYIFCFVARYTSLMNNL